VPFPTECQPGDIPSDADGPGASAAAGAGGLLAGVVTWVMLSCLVLAPLPPVCVVFQAYASAQARGDTVPLLRDYAAPAGRGHLPSAVSCGWWYVQPVPRHIR